MPVELSRRKALVTALSGAAALGVVRAGGSDAGAARLPRTQDQVLHAVRRLTYGATPELVAHVRRVGLERWLDEQLAGLPDVGAAGAPVGLSAVPLPRAVLQHDQRDALVDAQAGTFARAAWGSNQVYEVLVELFSNHLSIHATRDELREHKSWDDHTVVRAHALGRFTDMLVASAQSPAMLLYLNNATSRKPHPNENYARELLELHTVGVRGGYRQRDVWDAAKALTGLTVDDNGLFVYRPEWHVTGAVRVMGWRHANTDAGQGLEVALSLVRYLARHPMTARRVAEKLVRRFVDDTPPPGLVARAAKVYLAGDTAIVPVVRYVVASKEFAAASGRKAQRPYEWAAAAVRSLGLRPDLSLHDDGRGVVGLLGRLGQIPFAWPLPDGYPDNTVAWATTSSLLARWNAAQALVAGQVQGIAPMDVDALVGTPLPMTAGALVDRLCDRMLCQRPRPELRRALLRAVRSDAARRVDQGWIRRATPTLAALVLSSPEAQVR